MATSLVLNNVQRELNILDDGLPPEERLPPGHMRLFNFYAPSLQAALYSITATQHIDGGPPDAEGKLQSIDLFNTDENGKIALAQKFAVIAPQFSLDPKIINSYYPPDGHQDEGRILPHIVFSDPHAPWYRPAGMSDWMGHTVDTGAAPNTPRADGDDDRGNLMPWLGLMVFKANELQVPGDDAIALGLNTIKAGKTTAAGGSGVSGQAVETNIYAENKQPASGAFPMTIADYMISIKSRVNYEAGYTKNPQDLTELKTSTEKTSIIFPLKSTVQSVFNAQNDLQGLKAQKLQAHVRQLNTVGFPDAGVQGNGYYSVVVSSMTGDLTTIAPSNHVVHLVSLEHLDSTLNNTNSSMGPDNKSKRIGLVSLYTWTYSCIPEAVNFELMMTRLGQQVQPLRPPKEQLDALQSRSQTVDTKSKAAVALYKRLEDGYTIARWRAPSGEESVAFNRGPLVPTLPPEVPSKPTTDPQAAWPALSMNGKDYSIYDRSLGMLDATYASAWSLGKLVAISDSVFNAALMRFRSNIWNASTSNLRKTVNNVDDWSKILNDSVTAVVTGQSLASGEFSGIPVRINKPADVPLAPPVDHPVMAESLTKEIDKSVTKSATVPGSADDVLFNGFLLDSAANSDWEVVYKWIYDALYLGHIPAHFLFPDPSHLKSMNPLAVPPGQSKLLQEALRFFHIDHAWLDCFIDGALSCANHVEPQYDNIRLKIKQIVNNVLSAPVGTLKKTPPVPRYGFVIRSAAVKAVPDLKLTVRCWTRVPMQGAGNENNYEWVADPNYDPLVRHTKLDDSTILSLLDCAPEQIAYIEMAQPAHQQRFALGVDVGHDDTTQLVNKITPEVDSIKLFTNAARAPPNDEDGKPPDPALLELPDMEWKALLTAPLTNPSFYDSGSRCINSIAITEAICAKLVEWGQQKSTFDESEPPQYPAKGVASSSMFGLEMNDRAYHLRINGTQPSGSQESFPTWKRQLWTGLVAPNAPASISDPATPLFTPLKIAPPTTAPPIPTAVPLLNRSQAISLPISPIDPLTPNKGIKALNNPWKSSQNPQFEMLIHPDYCPPPLRPIQPTQGDPTKQIFSPIDFIATETKYLFDLVFSLRRRNKGDTHRNLRALRIEIPISRSPSASDNEKLTQLGDKPREPLLKSGETAHSGIRMAYNARFVPSLYNGPASRIGDVRWDDLPILGITMIPRSGTTTGTMYLGIDDRANALAVRLSECQLNPVVNEETTIAYKDASPNGWIPKAVEGATKVRVRLVEQYGDNIADEWSFCTVVKVRGIDKRFPDM